MRSVDVLRFDLDGQPYGLIASDVIEIIRAASAARLPDAPPIVLGVLNVGGELVPVYDLRARFGSHRREVAPSDTMILARAGASKVAIAVDRANDVFTIDDDALRAPPVVAPHHVRGLAALGDGTLVIVELGSFLSDHEALSLGRALEAAAAQP